MLLSCIFCNNAFENLWHLFLGCNFAQNCWQQAGLADTVNNMASNMDTYVQSLKDPMISKVMMILWSIWCECNERLWNRITRSNSSVVSMECL